ncbi:MAG: helix-turn-helix domain-containing protein [Candidatus Woesearchaeota archaeon]
MPIDFRNVGLSPYESKCYETLIINGSLNATKLCKLSGVPQGKIYLVTETLQTKGFITVLPSIPKMFKAISPEITIKRYVNEKVSALQTVESQMMKELRSLVHTSSDEIDQKIQIFRGRKNAFGIIHHLMCEAKKSIDLMFTFELMLPETRRLLNEAKQRKVRVRIIGTKRVNEKLIKEIVGDGFDIRFYPVQELRIVIKDGIECVEQIVNSRNLLDRTAIHIESRELSQALKSYFDKIWRKAEKI